MGGALWCLTMGDSSFWEFGRILSFIDCDSVTHDSGNNGSAATQSCLVLRSDDV